MKNLVIGTFIALGLAACSDSDGGGTGGAGGLQDPEDTSTSTGSGTGGDGSGGDSTSTASSSPTSTGTGGECGLPEGAARVCSDASGCENPQPDPNECLDEVQADRCAVSACTDTYDAFFGCVFAVVDSGNWVECPDYPAECEDEYNAYQDCISPGGCGEGPDIEVICAEAQECGQIFEDCVAELQGERCGYPEGECRTKFDTWLACFGDVAEALEWSECPDYPTACDAEYQDYAASCI